MFLTAAVTAVGPLVATTALAGAVVLVSLVLAVVWATVGSSCCGDASGETGVAQASDGRARRKSDAAAPPKDPAALRKVLMHEPSLSAVLAIVRITSMREAESVSKALVGLFEHEAQHMQLLQAVLSAEIAATKAETEGTLFRANSVANKMLVAYARLAGDSYLRATLAKPVKALLADKRSFEIDPQKVEPGDDVKKNAKALRRHCDDFVDALTNSLADMPPTLREMCLHLKEATTSKFPELGVTSVSGFLILRYFGPALVSPKAFGIVETSPSPQAGRALILISKVLQKMANGIQFGAKEQYLRPLNSYVADVTPRLQEFFSSVVDVETPVPHVRITGNSEATAALGVINAFIQKRISKLEEAMTQPLRRGTITDLDDPGNIGIPASAESVQAFESLKRAVYGQDGPLGKRGYQQL